MKHTKYIGYKSIKHRLKSGTHVRPTNILINGGYLGPRMVWVPTTPSISERVCLTLCLHVICKGGAVMGFIGINKARVHINSA